MIGNASASSADGTATRTIWHPAAVSSAICCSVAFTSVVGVVVIDCTDTGASPPTSTDPTLIWRDFRRSDSFGAGSAGMPRDTAVTVTSDAYGFRNEIGLTMSVTIVSSEMPPKIRITTYVTGMSLV
jgi:hypothetical protein